MTPRAMTATEVEAMRAKWQPLADAAAAIAGVSVESVRLKSFDITFNPFESEYTVRFRVIGGLPYETP